MEWVIPAVALLLLIWAVIIHRQLVASRQVAVQAWSELDEQFRRRQERIPRLLAMLQGHLDAESRPVQAVIQARRSAGSAQTPAAIGKAEATLHAALDKVIELAGAKAGLAADAGFLRLKSEFSEMENRIEASRRAFNTAAEKYNTARMGFPAAFLTYVVSLPALERVTVPKPAP